MASQSKRPRLDDSFSLGGHTGGVVPEGSQPAGESTRSGVCRSPWRARVCALYARTLSVLRRAAAHVLKKKQPGANGEREEGFLQAVRTHPFLCRCVVRYVETRQESTGQQVLVLENLCAGMGMPAVLDLKMGTRTYGDDATPEKVLEQTAKMMSSTTGTLGIRVVGARVPCERGGFTIEGSKYKNEPADEHGMRLFMRRFFRSPELLQQARIVLADLGVLPSDIEHVLCKVPPGWQGDLWLKGGNHAEPAHSCLRCASFVWHVSVAAANSMHRDIRAVSDRR